MLDSDQFICNEEGHFLHYLEGVFLLLLVYVLELLVDSFDVII